MKGPEAKRARPLAERFADLESRIHALRARHAATPQEHTVADLVNDLRARCDVLRSHLAGGPPDDAEVHHAHRGTGATWASAKSAPSRTDTPSASPDPRAEAAYRDLEDAYERALIRFRG